MRPRRPFNAAADRLLPQKSSNHVDAAATQCEQGGLATGKASHRRWTGQGCALRSGS